MATTLAIIICLCTLNYNAGDLSVSIIEPEVLEKFLPKDWKIESIIQTDTPTGWIKINGNKGIRVKFSNSNIIIHDHMIGDYHPSYSFTLMPLNWEGKSKLGSIFKNGKLTQNESLSEMQVYPDHFQKKYPDFYIFDSHLGTGDWKEPFKDLQRYFEDLKAESQE